MSTFLVVIDTLISSSQKRFQLIDEKIGKFEDLLLSSSVKGLSELIDLSHTPTSKKIAPPDQSAQIFPSIKAKHPPKPSSALSSIPPPPPPPTQDETASKPEAVVDSEETPVEITDDMDVETLAALAFQQRKKTPKQTARPPISRLGTGSLKMELMQELRKKFGGDIKDQDESN